jgi:hypothetical protein
MRTTTWEDLEGENAGVVMGTIAPLLRQIERTVPELAGLRDRYRQEAMSGDYENLMDVSHRYAYQHLQTTLHVPRERT